MLIEQSFKWLLISLYIIFSPADDTILQRGTGLSTPLTASSMSQFKSAEDLADYLKHFRADNIVNDAEFIRVRLVPDASPWTVLGQVKRLFFSFCSHLIVQLTAMVLPLGRDFNWLAMLDQLIEKSDSKQQECLLACAFMHYACMHACIFLCVWLWMCMQAYRHVCIFLLLLVLLYMPVACMCISCAAQMLFFACFSHLLFFTSCWFLGLVAVTILLVVPWSLSDSTSNDDFLFFLGQSYGGFCAVTYLSFAPQGLKQVLLTGGIPPIGVGCTADTVYRVCFEQIILQNEKYYKRYPGDVEVVREVVKYLAESEGGGVRIYDMWFCYHS